MSSPGEITPTEVAAIVYGLVVGFTVVMALFSLASSLLATSSRHGIWSLVLALVLGSLAGALIALGAPS